MQIPCYLFRAICTHRGTSYTRLKVVFYPEEAAEALADWLDDEPLTVTIRPADAAAIAIAHLNHIGYRHAYTESRTDNFPALADADDAAGFVMRERDRSGDDGAAVFANANLTADSDVFDQLTEFVAHRGGVVYRLTLGGPALPRPVLDMLHQYAKGMSSTELVIATNILSTKPMVPSDA